jgi:hypothetical protein
MTIFDLLFLACLFAAAATLLTTAAAAIRRQWRRCASILKRLAMGVVAYDAARLGLITGHGGPYCSSPIIGEMGCVFNKPTMVRVNQDFLK